MCVIAVVENEKGRPTAEVLEAMWDTNDDGAGIAWQEKGKVKFVKGLGFEEVRDLALTVPAPFVVHFRISSVGPTISKLTHPFPISADAPLDLKGTADKVIFHNGTWTDWQREGRAAVFNAGQKLPTGRWSDTRMMALIAHVYGEGVLDIIGEKVIAFGAAHPKDINIYGSGWRVWTKNGMNLLVSNTFWEGRYETILRSNAALLRTQAEEVEAEVITPGSEADRIHRPLWQDQQTSATASTEAPEGRPFTKPLSHFEEKHKRGEISEQGITRIRAAYMRQVAAGLIKDETKTNALVGPVGSQMIN